MEEEARKETTHTEAYEETKKAIDYVLLEGHRYVKHHV